MTVILIKREMWTQRHANKENAHEGEGRGWGDASIDQETPKTGSKAPEAGREAWDRSFYHSCRRS